MVVGFFLFSMDNIVIVRATRLLVGICYDFFSTSFGIPLLPRKGRKKGEERIIIATHYMYIIIIIIEEN